MLYVVTHLIPVIRYVEKLLAHVFPVMRYVLTFLTYVMPVIRYFALINKSYSIYKLWSESARKRYACHKVCYM